MRGAMILLTACLLTLGCAPGKMGIARNLETPEAMRAEILVQIPPGTPVATAMSIMESNQFSCERRTGEPFETAEFYRDAFDHLHCRRNDKAGPGRVRCWQVAIELHEESVTDVFVKIGYTGR